MVVTSRKKVDEVSHSRLKMPIILYLTKYNIRESSMIRVHAARRKSCKKDEDWLKRNVYVRIFDVSRGSILDSCHGRKQILRLVREQSDQHISNTSISHQSSFIGWLYRIGRSRRMDRLVSTSGSTTFGDTCLVVIEGRR